MAKHSEIKTLNKSDTYDYVFNMEHVFTDTGMKKLFTEFLKSEYNYEPYEFLLEVKKLESLTSEAERVKQALYIYKNFIGETCSKQVNLCSIIVKELSSHFEESQQSMNENEWKISLSYKELFKHAAKAIEFQLLRDSFVRFVRSDKWVRYVEKKGSEYLNKVAVLKMAHKLSYRDEDFVEYIVEDKDIDFFKELEKDSLNWKLIGSKFISKSEGSIHAFRMKSDYFPEVSFYKGSKLLKWSGILNYNFEHCWKVLFSMNSIIEYDDNVNGFDVYKYYTYEELKQKYPNIEMREKRSCVLSRVDTILPFPFNSARYSSRITTASYDPEKQRIYLVHKPCRNKIAEEKVPNAINVYNFQCYSLSKIDESRTFFCQIHTLNAFGQIQRDSGSRFSNGAKDIRTKLLTLDLAINLSKNIKKKLKNTLNPVIDPFTKLVLDVFKYHSKKIAE
jgi:hypothetical protein